MSVPLNSDATANAALIALAGAITATLAKSNPPQTTAPRSVSFLAIRSLPLLKQFLETQAIGFLANPIGKTWEVLRCVVPLSYLGTWGYQSARALSISDGFSNTNSAVLQKVLLPMARTAGTSALTVGSEVVQEIPPALGFFQSAQAITGSETSSVLHTILPPIPAGTVGPIRLALTGVKTFVSTPAYSQPTAALAVAALSAAIYRNPQTFSQPFVNAAVSCRNAVNNFFYAKPEEKKV